MLSQYVRVIIKNLHNLEDLSHNLLLCEKLIIITFNNY